MQKMKLAPNMETKLYIELKSRGFEFVDHEHAFWRAQKNKVTVVFFKNGTVLFQGNETAVESLQHELFPSHTPESTANETNSDDNLRVLGMDESGKGDYFGPLVLAGAVVGPESRAAVMKSGVMDSKKLSDNQIGNMAPRLIATLPHAVKLLEPEEYNRLYPLFGNLNILMASEYKKLMAQFSATDYDRIILDRFAANGSLNDDIKASARKEMIIVEKAEQNLAVAAASIIARFYFIEWLAVSESKFGIALPKGSGSDAGKLFASIKAKSPKIVFERMAKAHFKEPERKLF